MNNENEWVVWLRQDNESRQEKKKNDCLLVKGETKEFGVEWNEWLLEKVGGGH